jgi:hypothetical protein
MRRPVSFLLVCTVLCIALAACPAMLHGNARDRKVTSADDGAAARVTKCSKKTLTAPPRRRTYRIRGCSNATLVFSFTVASFSQESPWAATSTLDV